MTTSGMVHEMNVAVVAGGTTRRRASRGSRGSRKLTVGLWVAQAALAVAFGAAGAGHATQPVAEMAKMAPWTGALPEALVRFIGVVELAGALGLLLPALTRVKPVLTAWAATGLATVMALASVVHLVRGEPQVVPVNLVLGGVAAFIAWGRFRRIPIVPRAARAPGA